MIKGLLDRDTLGAFCAHSCSPALLPSSVCACISFVHQPLLSGCACVRVRAQGFEVPWGLGQLCGGLLAGGFYHAPWNRSASWAAGWGISPGTRFLTRAH